MSFTGTKGGWNHIARTNQEQANKLCRFALDSGVNFFDTADIYSNGRSEEMLGIALHRRRHEAVIATKCGFRMEDGPHGDGLSRKRVLEACDASLRRLRTEYIDLYQMHSFDFLTPLEESLSAFDILVKQGKVRYIGISNFYAWQLMKALGICEKYRYEKFISLQAYYSLLGRDLETELVPACLDSGLGILPWSPLHGGVLSAKYHQSKKWPVGTRITKPGETLPYNDERGRDILDLVVKIARKREKTPAQIAINYLLRKPGIASVVIGARDQTQLAENLAASDWQLSPEEVSELDKVSAPPRLYPQWYFDYFRKDQLERLAGING